MAESDHPKNRKIVSLRVVALLVAVSAAVVWKSSSKLASSDSDNGPQSDQTTLAMPAPALVSEWKSAPASPASATSVPESSTPAGYSELFATPEGYAFVSPLDESPPALLADPSDSAPSKHPPATDAASPVPSFPVEQRIWTNYSGKVMVASIEWCDYSTGSLILRDDTGVLRPCEIKHLSAADQAYVLQFSQQK